MLVFLSSIVRTNGWASNDKDEIPYFLYNNKIAVLTSGPDQDVTFVSIYSEMLAKAYTEQFDIYWEKSETIRKI